ncbi:conserved oligomeric Golgi complex subunit 5 [Elaeis guineensis]|uniref:Conserved oligomeric Golgi complex subunit 5 n=1 Tax=Elaeis guineensis var. tenera TaxID=51953 RepID=A0A6I9RC69_ELAGV|nr:conserved oligomeric Golgi complex subunit 5 [Elaeis guineensis]
MASPRILPSSPLQKLATFKDPAFSPAMAVAPPSSSDASPLDTFASDPVFSDFLSSDFDSARFSSQALSSGSAAARAESLQDAIRLLEKHLRSEVLARHSSLLSQLSSLRDAESSLSAVRSGVVALQSSLHRARQEIADPRRLVRSHTLQLSNLHAAADLLQSSARLLRLSRKLRDLMSHPPDRLDLAKAAEMHREIELLYEERGLAGISVVEDEIHWLSDTGNRLRSEAMKAVERGMDESNQNDIWCGLQVFYNLGELRSTVDSLINKYKGIGVKSVGSALDMKAISASSGGFGPGGVQRSGTPQIGGGKRAGEALWERMARCMDELHKVMTAVWQLQTVLSKKRVPFTQILFLHEVWQEGDPLLTDRVWEALVKAFASQMKSAFTASSFVKEVFTHGYPKLFTMVENLLERISRDTTVKGVLPALTPEGKDQMVASIDIFQTAFLALCLSRLSDYVNSIFPVSSRGSIPSKDQISKIILRIQEEIEVVRMHGHLMLLVLHEIGKVLLLLAERAEYQISTGPEARQVTGPATPAQLKNFALCQHLQEIHTRISSTVSSLPTVASDVLSPSLGVIYGVACDSVTSLFQAMLDRLESCIIQIHEQDFGDQGMDAAMDNNASAYMEEFQKCTVHFRNEFLSKLLPSSASRSETICTRLVRRMASRVLIFFIRHAALVRPLSESGKLRMARDMAELELAVGQNLFPVEQLGAPYRALRAFRPVIFLETSQLGGSPLLRDLPPSVILHHLYSRGPDELQSPLQRNKLTALQYSLWLDSQGEDQIWKGIKATLDDYEIKVRARGDKEFSPVYPLMLQIGSSVAETISSQS